MIVPSIREITASDGYRLKFRHWAAVNPQGIVIALHGIQSHSGWYEYSSNRMAEAGFSVYFADRRGAGLNGAQRGHAAHGMRLIHDVRSLIQTAISECSTEQIARPEVTLLGISWGGKIATGLAALFPNEIDQLVLMYPGLIPRFQMTRWQQFRLNLARSFEVVKKHIPIPLDDPGLFTRSSEWQKFISSDPLALHTVTSSFLNSGRDLDSIFNTHAANVTQPTLLMLAEDDQIIDNAAVRQRLLTAGSLQTSTVIYPQCRHSLEFEPHRDAIFSDLVTWLQSHPCRRFR
jgi:alpha-beta hydrolase superfamily lysophospholipase